MTEVCARADRLIRMETDRRRAIFFHSQLRIYSVTPLSFHSNFWNYTENHRRERRHKNMHESLLQLYRWSVCTFKRWVWCGTHTHSNNPIIFFLLHLFFNEPRGVQQYIVTALCHRYGFFWWILQAMPLATHLDRAKIITDATHKSGWHFTKSRCNKRCE